MIRKALSISALALAAALHATAGAAAPRAQPLSRSFDQVFAASDQGSSAHFQATFVSNDAEHRLEVWRDGETRLKRSTDAGIETYVTRTPGQAEFDMTVLDLRRKIATRIQRSNLYRIGNFTDWFDLAHGLRHPKGGYRLVASQPPRHAPVAIESCTWYTLTQAGRAAQICWSARRQLPLTIVSQQGRVIWRLTAVDQRPIPAALFAVHDQGSVRNDANEDIERD